MSIAEMSRVRVVRVGRTTTDVTWLMGRLARFLDGETSVLVPVGDDRLPPAVVHDVEDRVVWLPEEVGLVVRTSGSTTGTGRLVGLSAGQMRASGAATRQRLGGPCTWILGLPPHHIAGLQVVARAVADGRDVVTIEGHVDPPSVTAAIEQAEKRHSDGRVAISLVPTQLAHLVDDPRCSATLARCVAVLVGAAGVGEDVALGAVAGRACHRGFLLRPGGLFDTCHLVAGGRSVQGCSQRKSHPGRSPSNP